MSRVSTNTVSLAYAIEDSLGVLPVTPVWKTVEPNTIGAFGPEIGTVARAPISKNRQRRKGTIVDLDSSAEFEGDATMEHLLDFLPSFLFASFAGAESYAADLTNQVTACDTDSFTVDDNGDNFVAGQLIYARGFSNAANNGIHVVDTGATTTDIPVTSTLVAETAPASARLDGHGVQGATGDIEIDADGNIISTTLDFTTLDLTAGQMIWVGGVADVTRFGTAASPSVNRGWARVTLIEANKLTIDKTSTTFAVDAGTGKTIHLYFGRFLRNVPVDDSDYLEQSLQFEGAYPDLDSVGTPAYEYSIGNYCNQIDLNLPLTDKATISFGFIGTDTEPPTTTRKTGAATPVAPYQTAALNTSADISRLRITEVDESGLTTFFKNVTLTINNNVSPEKVLANLGAVFMNVGNLEIDTESQVLFTNADVPAAIRDNTTVTMDFSLRNDDGAVFFDIPACTIGDGSKEFPVNETVLINTPVQAFEDPDLGYSMSASFFAWTPTS